MAYSSDEVEKVVADLEKCAERQAASKGATVKLRACERDLLTCAEAGRNLLLKAVKGDKALLEQVFGGTCEHINRLRVVIDAVEFSDMHKNDARWNDLNNACTTVEEVLQQLGLYKPWQPPKLQPPEIKKFRGLRSHFSPGDFVHMRAECEGGEVTSFTIEPMLPPELSLDGTTGTISGQLSSGTELDTTFTVTARNEAGETKFDFNLNVKVMPPTSVAYPTLPSECYTGEAVHWDPEVESGGATEWTIDPSLPKGLFLQGQRGTISGVPSEEREVTGYTVTAANAGGSTTAVVNFGVKLAPPVSLTYNPRSSYGVGESMYLLPNLVLKKFGHATLNKIVGRPTRGLSSTMETAASSAVFTVDPGLPSGIVLAESTGVIAGRPTMPVDEAVYQVTARNSGGEVQCDLRFSILVTPPVGLKYQDVEMRYFTGQPVMLTPEVEGLVDEWGVEPGLPVGMVLDPATGGIGGTPTTVTPEGLYTVTARNAEGESQAVLTFAVVRVPPSSLGYPSLEAVYPHLSLVRIHPTCEGEVDEYAVSPALPSGLALNPSSGIIEGTAESVADEATYIVTATNDTGETSTSLTFAVKVMPPVAVAYPQIDDTYALGEEVRLEPSIEGGATTWTVEPPLPSGMVIDATTGHISGAPTITARETSYVVTASNDAGGTSAVLTFAVTEPPPKGLSYPAAVNNYIVEEEILLEPEILGGACTNYSVEPALPAGLSLDTRTGVISGAPDVTTELASYAVTCRNARGSATCELAFECSEPAAPAEVDQLFASQIEEVTDIADLMEEPPKQVRLGDWMIWMVHRAWLNDPTLTEFDFSNIQMPPPHQEQRIAPKLMMAMATNTYIKALLLPNANLQKSQGPELAESLKVNTTLKTLNIENNNVDSAAIRAIAEAVKVNEACGLEQLRLANQKHVGAFFGRPVEQAIGELMETNNRIVKLGFVCQDAHWRNSIDRAILRNNDYARRRRKRGMDGEDEIAAEERSLSRILLSNAPSQAAGTVFDDSDAKVMVVRGYVASTKKLPTTSQLQSFAKGRGNSLPYSTVAPLIKDFRAKVLNSALNTGVIVSDAFATETPGTLRAWSEKNENWSLDVWPDDDHRLNFTLNKQPAIEVSDEFATWLCPGDAG